MKSFKFTIILMLFCFVLFVPVFGQQKDRIVKRIVWKAEPIKIVNVKTKNNIIELEKKFVENDDWLENFSIQVENISTQTIVYLEVEIVFPQGENGLPERPAFESLRYGIFPRLPNVPQKVKTSEPLLQPGDEATLELDGYEGLQIFLESTGHPKSIREVTVRIGRVVFTDGTMWSSGKILKQDVKDPDTWVVQPTQVSSNRQANYLDLFAFNRKYSNFSELLATISPSNAQNSTPVTNECREFVIENTVRCNNYTCYAPGNQIAGQFIPDGLLFREETARCKRDDNGQDCFAYANAGPRQAVDVINHRPALRVLRILAALARGVTNSKIAVQTRPAMNRNLAVVPTARAIRRLFSMLTAAALR